MSFVHIEVEKSGRVVIDTEVLPYNRAFWRLRMMWNEYALSNELLAYDGDSPIHVIEHIVSYPDFKVIVKSIG